MNKAHQMFTVTGHAMNISAVWEKILPPQGKEHPAFNNCWPQVFIYSFIQQKLRRACCVSVTQLDRF